MRALFGGGVLVALCAAAAQAAEYPSRPVRMISGFAAGGGVDATARPINQKLAELLGQQMIIDNRPGGGGNIAAEIAARAEPDGYTVLLVAPAFVINFGLHPQLPFNLERDFTAVTQLVDSMNILSVHPSVTANTVPELVQLAKSRSLSFGSSGVGTVGHLAGELFNLMAGTKLVHIPYKGGGPVLVDLIGGQIQIVFASAGTVLPQIKAGKIKALAVTALRRSSAMPEVPTLAESGLPGYEARNWYGMVAPANTPHAVVERLNAAIGKVLNMPDVKKTLAGQGLDAMPTTPDAFNAYLRSERDKWVKVIKASDTRPE
jgi:tripartite-type tricarboxylate transporter receptor subunit TctC